MDVKLSSIVTIMISALALMGCQTTANLPSKDATQYENIVTLKVDIDSDGDGVLDAIDECPETRLSVVVDVKGCEIIIEGSDALEMEFNGFFLPMSSQLPDIYDDEFTKIEEKLNEYPKASIFIFGHAATNEIDDNVLANFSFNSLSRNRALIIKNTLVLTHNIASERIRTYDCSNKKLAIDTDFIDRNFKALNLENIESKQRRVTLKASSEVSHLNDLKYVSYSQMYGEYAKHCEPFE